MKKYNSQQEFEADIKDGIFKSRESIDITGFNLDIREKIEVAGDITAGNITAGDITAWNINAEDITAGNITAEDITAWNINARDITAEDISYFAVAFAFKNIKCKKIVGRRENSKHFVLDGKIELTKP